MVYAPYMRVLGRIRLSRMTEESTSAARQREIIEMWAKSNDHEIVGWAEDIDVSGSVDPCRCEGCRGVNTPRGYDDLSHDAFEAYRATQGPRF